MELCRIDFWSESAAPEFAKVVHLPCGERRGVSFLLCCVSSWRRRHACMRAPFWTFFFSLSGTLYPVHSHTTSLIVRAFLSVETDDLVLANRGHGKPTCLFFSSFFLTHTHSLCLWVLSLSDFGDMIRKSNLGKKEKQKEGGLSPW